MVGGIIYSDIVLVFKADVQNGARILSEIDDIWNASVTMHDTVVVVRFWPEHVWGSKPDAPKTISEGMKKAKAILKKYAVGYKVKKFTF